MKPGLLWVAMLTLAVGGCASAPAWDRRHVQELRFTVTGRNAAPTIVRDPAAIDDVMQCLGAAKEIGRGSSAQSWPLAIGVSGERPERGLWLYHPGTGEFTRLDHRRHPIYRLPDAERRRINRHLPPGADAGSPPCE